MVWKFPKVWSEQSEGFTIVIDLAGSVLSMWLVQGGGTTVAQVVVGVVVGVGINGA